MDAELDKILVIAEYTDTFGGEANYCWVKRASKHFPADVSERAVVSYFKAEMGLTGVPCRRERYSDTIALYPRGSCTVLFIYY